MKPIRCRLSSLPRLLAVLLHIVLLQTVLFQKYSIVYAASQSELVIEITSGVERQTRLAVVPMQWQGPGVLPESVAQIVSDDLYRSGLFAPLPLKNMLSRPSQAQQVVFSEWQAMNMEYLVVGRIFPAQAAGKRYRFELSLLDVQARKSLLTINGAANHLRDLAHHASDRIYQALTGQKGAFSTHILYVAVDQKGGKRRYRLKRADSDGHRAVTLFESANPIMSPTWSPDAKQVAYVSYHHDRRPGIYIHDIASGAQHKLVQFKGLNGAPDWSADGQSMVMTLSRDGNPEIYHYDLKRDALKRLTRNSAIDTEPRWMPDGKSIVFTSNRGGSPQIYQLNLAKRKVRRLTFEGSYNARASVSPDGRYLAMVHQNQGRYHIAVQDLQTQTFSIVTQTQYDESPSIAPNGSMLIYATGEGATGILAAVSIDGNVKVKLPARHGSVREPAWSPVIY